MRDNASLGRAVFEATSDDNTNPNVPLALGKLEFCAREDNASEASGKMVACVGAAKIDETRDKAALGRPVLEATNDERTTLAAPVGTDTIAVALAPLLPNIAVGISPASTLSRPVAAIPRQRTSVQVVRAPLVPAYIDSEQTSRGHVQTELSKTVATRRLSIRSETVQQAFPDCFQAHWLE
ncbi:hypothetical protein KCU62_g105, partial [Aureobasidium sp. EXF-3399]